MALHVDDGSLLNPPCAILGLDNLANYPATLRLAERKGLLPCRTCSLLDAHVCGAGRHIMVTHSHRGYCTVRPRSHKREGQQHETERAHVLTRVNAAKESAHKNVAILQRWQGYVVLQSVVLTRNCAFRALCVHPLRCRDCSCCRGITVTSTCTTSSTTTTTCGCGCGRSCGCCRRHSWCKWVD